VTADGRPYMVMEFVEGRPITDYCAFTRAPLAERMRLFMQVCEAVAYAHRNLVVHRDLKPANILVTPQGQVKLLDFGIAKLIDVDGLDLTQTAAAPLTPLTAAPEQLLGLPITTAADIYALGLLLFELLTDTQPWMRAGSPIAQAVRVILDQPAPVPSRRAAEGSAAPFPPRVLRGDFDAIVAKALRKESQHRYATVEALEADVGRAWVASLLLRDRVRVVCFRPYAAPLPLGHGRRRGCVDFPGRGFGGCGLAGAASRIRARCGAPGCRPRRGGPRSIDAAVPCCDRRTRGAACDRESDDRQQRFARITRISLPAPAQGEIVLTLADLYAALQDAAGASALLEGFLRQAGSDTDPAALADARQKLANNELLQGHTGRAAELVSQAEAFWNLQPRRYAEERLEGLTVKARVQRLSGDLAGSGRNRDCGHLAADRAFRPHPP